MKPSEALRKGAQLVPAQVKGIPFAFNHNGDLCGACALGAMYVGAGGTPKHTPTHKIVNELETMLEITNKEVPTGDRHAADWWVQVFRANDDYGTSFEDIAVDLERWGL